MATAEAKIYFRDVVAARGAKTETCGFYPTNLRTFSESPEVSILVPQSTEFHRILHTFTATTTNLPIGPEYGRTFTHFTPFSKFFKKKVIFFKKSVDIGIPLCYTLDD